MVCSGMGGWGATPDHHPTLSLAPSLACHRLGHCGAPSVPNCGAAGNAAPLARLHLRGGGSPGAPWPHTPSGPAPLKPPVHLVPIPQVVSSHLTWLFAAASPGDLFTLSLPGHSTVLLNPNIPHVGLRIVECWQPGFDVYPQEPRQAPNLNGDGTCS